MPGSARRKSRGEGPPDAWQQSYNRFQPAGYKRTPNRSKSRARSNTRKPGISYADRLKGKTLEDSMHAPNRNNANSDERSSRNTNRSPLPYASSSSHTKTDNVSVADKVDAIRFSNNEIFASIGTIMEKLHVISTKLDNFNHRIEKIEKHLEIAPSSNNMYASIDPDVVLEDDNNLGEWERTSTRHNPSTGNRFSNPSTRQFASEEIDEYTQMFDDDEEEVEDLNALPKEDLIARHQDFVTAIETMQLDKEKSQGEISDLKSHNESLKDEVREMKEQLILLSTQINAQLGTNSPARHQ